MAKKAAARKARASTDEDDAGPGATGADTTGTDSDPKFEYQVLDEGCVVEGITFPDADADEGWEMKVELTEKQARKHTDAGVRLSKIT